LSSLLAIFDDVGGSSEVDDDCGELRVNAA
jgi:hypothetical protein